MTIPVERTLAVERTRDFLLELVSPAKLSRADVRKRALSLLKHYPSAIDMEVVSRKVPEVFSIKF